MEGGDKVQGSVDPRFAAGLPFPVPEILELKASRDVGRISNGFPGISLGTDEEIPETATAFLSFSEEANPPEKNSPKRKEFI